MTVPYNQILKYGAFIIPIQKKGLEENALDLSGKYYNNAH